ncbi:universal stress protein [Christiangramia sediminis]|uniref:Universal stress protein n=1 Tax=Christiangramia sediminis TaxID=2881336 RepID=A0A9X1LIN1_9FLAO|nr:universal stress protein [Christiangramia sediminis]MCB7481035.1 universal stress protein [Christiangramia sediminis]
MRKILIPTDFSKNAENATKLGVELFKYEICEIYIMHAYAAEVYQLDPLMEPHFLKSLQQRISKMVTTKLYGIEEEIKKISPNPKHKISSIAKFGLLLDETRDYADLEDVDLIIMGTRVKTGDKKITFGSNTLQVIKYVKCPVLAVPESYHGLHPQNILFSTDFLLPFKRRELKLICSIAKSYAARLHFLYISNSKELSSRQKENKNFIESFTSGIDVKFDRVPGKDITETVNAYVQDKHIDLLVMTNARHSYLENILYTSSIEKIGLKIQIPFLVLQNLQRI